MDNSCNLSVLITSLCTTSRNLSVKVCKVLLLPLLHFCIIVCLVSCVTVALLLSLWYTDVSAPRRSFPNTRIRREALHSRDIRHVLVNHGLLTTPTGVDLPFPTMLLCASCCTITMYTLNQEESDLGRQAPCSYSSHFHCLVTTQRVLQCRQTRLAISNILFIVHGRCT